MPRPNRLALLACLSLYLTCYGPAGLLVACLLRWLDR